MHSQISAADTAWVLVSSALVLVMTPALGFFYGGMVRKKNVLSTLTLSFVMMGLASLEWICWGYTLAFGKDLGGIIGSLDFLGLKGTLSTTAPIAPNLPHLAFVAFQMMFAIITPALITGAFVERVNFGGFLLFSLLWTTVVYDPLCHWVWGKGGWMAAMGAADFAGGTVVHIAAGFSALALALAIGPRRGFPSAPMEPHNIPFTVLGAGLLWMGWFGFNAGSALGANSLAATALVNTNTAAAAGALGWMALSWREAKPSALGIATGAVVGLVAITPAAGFVSPMAAIAIGALAAPVSYYAMGARHRWGMDESLDVWACHGMAGVWGAIATGIFADPSVNGVAGLFYGHPGQVLIQALSVAATIVFTFGMSWILAKIVDGIVGLRVSEMEEEVGLDISTHGERAYS